jgi:hypothetical protein
MSAESGFECSGLAERFVEYNANGTRQIQATDFGIEHGDREASIPIGMQKLFGQSAGFPSKNQAIVLAKIPMSVAPNGLSSQI